jgi:beta-xylosidase
VHADVPDLSMIRVGDTYYMSSTTMHLSPGLPIMRSKDLVNWEIVRYAYDILEDHPDLNLDPSRNAYGRGTWASSLRHHQGTFYLSTFAQTTGKTYVFQTRNLEQGPWQVHSFPPALHDHSLFFDDDGRVFMLYGAGDLRLAELQPDLSGLKPNGFNQVILTQAGRVAGPNLMLPAEGSQLFKIQGRYYLLNITWPRGGMRTVVLHRADHLTGPYESRLALQDQGVAQGGLIDTPNGEWFAYLFRDAGAVGRIPYLVPVQWEDGWPVLGIHGKVPNTLDLPPSRGLIPGIVASDDFDRPPGHPPLPLVWQWNHNPVPNLWSLTQRPGFLRLTTGRVDPDLLSARNTLTQRTFGPQSSASTSLDPSRLKPGDHAGLALLQRHYGYVGVHAEENAQFLVLVLAPDRAPEVMERIALPPETQNVHLRAEADFNNQTDRARFFYRLDSGPWIPLGQELRMRYTLPHFMGYRFALFHFATREPGGHADFDHFHLDQHLTPPVPTSQ